MDAAEAGMASGSRRAESGARASKDRIRMEAKLVGRARYHKSPHDAREDVTYISESISPVAYVVRVVCPDLIEREDPWMPTKSGVASDSRRAEAGAKSSKGPDQNGSQARVSRARPHEAR